jgi:hypothetical protein
MSDEKLPIWLNTAPVPFKLSFELAGETPDEEVGVVTEHGKGGMESRADWKGGSSTE